MSNYDNIRDETKAEQQKLKAMTSKEKISYIIYYYKYHFIVAAAVGIFLISSLVTWLSQRECVFNCSMINTNGFYESSDSVAEDFASYAGIDTGKYEVFIDTSLKISGDDGKMGDQLAYNSLAKLLAMFSAGTIDSLIANYEVIDHYGSLETFEDLRDVLDKDVYAKLLNDNLIYFVDIENKGPVPVAIDVTDSSKLRESNLYDGSYNIYVTIPAGCKNKDNSIKFTSYLLGY